MLYKDICTLIAFSKLIKPSILFFKWSMCLCTVWYAIQESNRVCEHLLLGDLGFECWALHAK